MKTKTFETVMTKADLEEYNVGKEGFVNKFLKANKKYGVTEKSDVYSLLLNCSVTLEDKLLTAKLLNDTISELSGKEKLHALTAIDGIGHSPLSNLLDRGNSNILNLFRDFINKHIVENEIKMLITISDNDEKENILTAIEFSQFADVTPKSLFQDFLKPIYQEESLLEISEIVDYIQIL